jgi:hypothetical protein
VIVSIDAVSEMRISHNSFRLETQPRNELDGCLVVLW